MNNLLFSRLAVDNIRKNKNTYLPYILSSILMISLFYILHNITGQVGQDGFYGEDSMKKVLNFGVYTAGILSAIFIFYTNSYLLKRRKKELGLYSVLGMEKRHIGKVLFFEAVYSGAISLLGGLVTGLVFSRLMFALLINILKLNTSFEFGISSKSIFITIILFIINFLAVMLFNLLKVYISNPIDLIKGETQGEKEPKGSMILALTGLIFLGIGYYLELTIKNPKLSLQTFFIASILITIATYLLFTSGSISMLKMLRRSKSFYYNKNNFISISNMFYRMKQNAIGLANIALLSTIVIFVISTTISLYAGIEDTIKTRFTHDVMTRYMYDDEDIDKIQRIITEHGILNNLEAVDVTNFPSLMTTAFLKENNLILEEDNGDDSHKDMYEVDIITLEDYNKIEKTNLSLNKDEVFIRSNTNEFSGDSINIYGRESKVKSKPDGTPYKQFYGFNAMNIIVNDIDILRQFEKLVNESQDYKSLITYEYNFNLIGEKENETQFISTLKDKLMVDGVKVISAESYDTAKESTYSQYGSLFFIGLFLGSLFMIATVLIIYYKQISEGYDDKERFEILQKVGMSKEEVRKTIRSQILIVFFLPLITAIIHITVAFPLVKKIMSIMNLTNTNLFLIFTGVVILIFGIVYALVYRWTARIYYKIVN